MRRVLTFVFALATLATSSEATPLTTMFFEFDGSGYVGDEAGTFPSPLPPTSAGFYSDSPTAAYDFLDLFESAVIEVRSGPLLNMTIWPGDEFPSTLYEYDGGTVSLEATWLVNGSSRFGNFVAPIPNFTLLVRDEGIGVDFCGGVCVHTQDFLTIGPGLFDADLASYLGVSRYSLPGDMNWYLEIIYGSPGDALRTGNFNASRLSIPLQAPEPGLAMLALLGVAGAALRRRLVRKPSRR